MQNNNIKETQEIVYASTTKRVLGFFIDYTIITFIRTFVLQICIYTFLAKHILSFFEATSQTLGEEFFIGKLGESHLQLFLQNSVFIELVLVLCLIILVAPIYNILLIKSKMKTTLGKRIFKVYPKVDDGSEPSALRIACHYFTSLIPVILIIGFISIEMLKYHKIIDLQYPDITIVIVLLAFVSWYDLAFITKKHIMVHDLICGIVFISKGKKGKERSIFFLNTFLEKQISKARQNLKDTKEKTQVSKAKFKETIKKAPKEIEVKKAKIKKKTSAKKTTIKKATIKKSSTKKAGTKIKSKE
jgi:uncharacterized RDD family membrane protein YckC